MHHERAAPPWPPLSGVLCCWAGDQTDREGFIQWERCLRILRLRSRTHLPSRLPGHCAVCRMVLGVGVGAGAEFSVLEGVSGQLEDLDSKVLTAWKMVLHGGGEEKGAESPGPESVSGPCVYVANS